jgi:hypothetical protein
VRMYTGGGVIGSGSIKGCSTEDGGVMGNNRTGLERGLLSGEHSLVDADPGE